MCIHTYLVYRPGSAWHGGVNVRDRCSRLYIYLPTTVHTQTRRGVTPFSPLNQTSPAIAPTTSPIHTLYMLLTYMVATIRTDAHSLTL
jgi:hypothetical protein